MLITLTSTHAGTAKQAGSVTFRLHAAAWGAVESRTPNRALLLASWMLLATPGHVEGCRNEATVAWRFKAGKRLL